LEAGRYTQDDVHFAIVDGQAVPVSDTDFANDATFGYSSSGLKEFLQERSNGSIAAEDVLSISLKDIRDEGASHVESLLADARNRRWVVINAETYEDMQVVADAVTALEKQGHRFITRCGPSFVRPLAGQSDPRILDSADIATDPERLQHGLVVVGSHVGLTTQQLHVLQERGGLVEYELDVRQL
ncbi:four-carbon acid sugar kinase family protein, partial [Luteolibacter marinus]